MNERIRNLNIESLVFLDAETVSRNKELIVGSKEYELWRWYNRDKKTDYFLSDKELCDLYKRKAALHPFFNKIVCISYGVLSNGTFYYKNITGDEKTLVETFYEVLNTGKYTPVSYNGIGFDMPTIRLKAFQNNSKVTLLDRFSDADKKPWLVTDNHIDLMNIAKGTYYHNLSLDGMCYIAGIESPKNDLKGDEVSIEYYENGVDNRISTYCAGDVIATAKLLIKMMGNDPDEIIKQYVDKTGSVVEKKEIPLIEHIVNTGSITSEQVLLVKEYVEKNDLNKEDVFKIIIAALSKKNPNIKNTSIEVKELKKELGLNVDTGLIKCVVEKGSIGKIQVNKLLTLYKDKDEVLKNKVIKQVEDYIEDLGKSEQVRIKKSIELLKEQLK